jgi:hypothetical protein
MYNDLREFQSTDLVKHFNSNTRDKYWGKPNNKQKEHIIATVEALITYLPFALKKGRNINQVEKAVGNYHEIPCGITTENASKISSSEKTGDSIIGTKLIGEIVTEEFKRGNLTIDTAEDWIYENLWLWAQCTVTKEEHKSENIKRQNQHKLTLDEKVVFGHYPAGTKIIYN